MPTVSEQLRTALKHSGQSMYEVSKATGVHTSVLSRFVVSGAQLRSANLDALCTHLDLELRPKAAAKRKQKASK